MRLPDTYSFPGFHPEPIIQGIFGDSKARVVSLRRRRKKRPAAFADKLIEASTISEFSGSATSTAPIDESIWNSSFEGFCVGVAGP